MDELFDDAPTETEIHPAQIELFDVEAPPAEVEDDDSPAVVVGCTCAFCGTSVDASSESTFSEVLSWVHGKKKDSSVLRSYTGRYACSNCVNVFRTGVDPRQPNALELLEAKDTSAAAPLNLFTDQSPDYVAGYRFGTEGGVVSPEDITSGEWRAGYLAGRAEWKAEKWVGSPRSSD